MRILGTTFLVMGVLCALLFIVFAFTGDANWAAFFIPLVLIVSGLRIRRTATGILQQTPSARGPGAASGAFDAAQAAGTPTIELPMTPDGIAAVSRQLARSQKWMWWLVGGALVLFIGMGVVFGISGEGADDRRQMIAIFGGMGLASAAFIGAIVWFSTLGPMRRDLVSPTYFRTTGPVQLVYIRNGHMLRLADRAFMLRTRDGVKELRALGSGIVDHTPHAHVILAAWNAEGAQVFALKGYTPDRPPL